MKITGVKTILLTGPLSHDPYITKARKKRSAAFIEIETDTELKGLGETYIGYSFPESVASIVEFFEPILIGQTVESIDVLWSRMYHCGNFWCRVGLGLAVLNGIEAALWDLKGKAYGLPVYELLGGRKHESLPAYATGGPSNYPESELKGKIDHYLGLGFRAFKLGAGCLIEGEGFKIADTPMAAAEFEGRKMERVRAHVGDSVQVMLDGHMGNSPHSTWGYDTALAVLRAVEPYNVFFFEEPLPYTDPWSYAELRGKTAVPVAGGECLTGTYEWRVFVELDCFDIGQPDASFTGGIGEFMRVAAMLESRGRDLATHSWGAGGSFMQNIHAGFASGNTVILEIAPDYGPLHEAIIDSDFRMENGRVLPPEKPGFGIELTDEIKNRYPFIPGSGEHNRVTGKEEIL